MYQNKITLKYNEPKIIFNLSKITNSCFLVSQDKYVHNHVYCSKTTLKIYFFQFNIVSLHIHYKIKILTHLIATLNTLFVSISS